MKTDSKPVVRYEDAAEHRDNISGWICKTCSRFWGVGEHMARWCCATELPCPDCGGRNSSKSWTVCEACRRKNEAERWAKLERVEWDGKTPLCEWDGDRYLFDEDDLAGYVADQLAEGGRLEDIHLVLCRQCEPRPFEMAEFQSDHLPEDFDGGKVFDEIDRIVNGWIEANVPQTWEPTGKAIDPEALRGLVDKEDFPDV